METKTTLMDLFRTERKYMEYGNYYPSHKSYAYTIFGLFMFLYSWIQLASMLAELYSEFGNWTKLIETLLYCMTYAAYLSKLTNFMINRKGLLKIERFLEDPILNDLNRKQEEILVSYVVSFQRLAKVYRLLCVLVIVFYAIIPFVAPGNLLASPGWFPVDVETYRYEIICAQCVASAIGAVYNSSIDILNCILMTFGSAHFDILKRNLENASDTSRTNGRLHNEALKNVLRTCARHHQILVEYTKAVEDMFSAGIFVQFACTAIALCLTGFQMLVISFKSVQFVFLIVYINGLIFQIALYCWYGNELNHNSSGISEACYMSNWDESDSEARKLIWIIMERGKRSVTIKAGNFFILSLTTLMAVLRSSYSYFAVLRTLYDD